MSILISFTLVSLAKFTFLSNLTNYAVFQKNHFSIDIDYYFDIIAPLI